MAQNPADKPNHTDLTTGEAANDVRAWASKVEAAIRAKAKGKDSAPVTAALWPYSVGRHEYLSCDMQDGEGNDYSITFQVGERLGCHFDPHSCEPCVPDMPGALYMAYLVLLPLQATVTFGRAHRRAQLAG